jgi:hypothetical protein
MAATITDKFKRDILEDLYTSFQNSFDSDTTLDSADLYYIGIGRSEEWDSEASPPLPFPDEETSFNFQNSLQAVKRVLDQSYVVPRRNWSAGSVYTAWNDKNHSDTTVGTTGDILGSYYVITDELNVYVCLMQGMSDEGIVRNSLYKPSEISETPFTAGPDGYVWRFLFNIGTYNSRRYLTSEWMPVEHIYDSSEGGPKADALSASRLAQALIQRDAINGELLAIEVDSVGTGYTSEPTITIHTNDSVTEAAAYARFNSSGQLFQVVMKDSVSSRTFSLGEGYGNETWITVSGGGGQGAVLRPIIHDHGQGLGHDPRLDLNSSSMMYSVRMIGDELDTFGIDNDFRQVGLIRNPLVDSSSDSQFHGLRGNVLKKLYVGSGINPEFTELDNTVTGLSSGAVARLDYYAVEIDSDCCDSLQNASSNVLYVHQTRETGFKPFSTSEAVELNFNGGIANIVSDSSSPALRPADVNKTSGDVLFVDNRLFIERDADQTEDVKIIIDL